MLQDPNQAWTGHGAHGTGAYAPIGKLKKYYHNKYYYKYSSLIVGLVRNMV